jgi:hypothetical protein
MHSMVLLDAEAQVETHTGLFGGSTNLDARQVSSSPQTYHRLRNLFGRT